MLSGLIIGNQNLWKERREKEIFEERVVGNFLKLFKDFNFGKRVRERLDMDVVINFFLDWVLKECLSEIL